MNQRKRAELIGALGAALLGAGVALIFQRVLGHYYIAFLLIGLLSHGWGMYEKHRLDSSRDASTPPWLEWAYWSCWVLLAGLAVYIVWDWTNRAPV